MTQRRGNRIRQPRREKVLSESETAAAGEQADDDHTAEIERRAYEIYLSRHGAPGDPVADWVQAERELQGAKTRGQG